MAFATGTYSTCGQALSGIVSYKTDVVVPASGGTPTHDIISNQPLCTSWIDFGTALNAAGVASQTDISTSLNNFVTSASFTNAVAAAAGNYVSADVPTIISSMISGQNFSSAVQSISSSVVANSYSTSAFSNAVLSVVDPEILASFQTANFRTAADAEISSSYSSAAFSTAVQAVVGASGAGSSSGAFDPVLAGEFFGFSFCGVVACWVVSHCAAMVIAPLLRR